MGWIEDFLQRRSDEGLLRRLEPISKRDGAYIFFGRERYIDFSSNDYLGLAGHPSLIEAQKEALDNFGASSSASRLLSGDFDIHHRLEEEVADFKGKEAAIVFNSGYQANVGIVSSLCGRGDAVFSDRLNHASIVDGIILSGSRLFRFAHNDTGHLESLLRRERGKFKKGLIITETVFSMDGDTPPLKELADLKDRYDCLLMVDEAHATGIYGEHGSGLVEEYGLADRVDLIMGTFGKALGGSGAYLAASASMVDYMINVCRSFIYSTGIPPAIAASNLAAIGLVREEPGRGRKVLEAARFFREGLKRMGFDIKGVSQIVPLIVGENNKARVAAERLQKKGYWILPIRPPTVAPMRSRLRFSLTFNHDKEMLRKLLEEISGAGI